MIRSVVAMVCAVLLASCGSNPSVSVPTPPKPTIKSFSVVPATNPKTYTLVNRNGAIGIVLPPIVGLGYTVENYSKQKILTEKISASSFSPGMDFTNAMVSALRDQGYAVKVQESVIRDPTDSTIVNYDKLDYSADAILHLYFTEIGIYSPPWSNDYVPRVNASATIFVKGHAHYLFEETIYYGADAREGKQWAIKADEQFAYPNFDFVLNNLESLTSAFSVGVREISKRMVEQIHYAVK
jgi:hypothetical protein